MSSKRDIIALALQPGDASILEDYRGRELDFFIERGRVYPEKLEEVFRAIYEADDDLDLVVIGPRGGGKTMGVYDGATARFMWKEDDVFAIGGSEKQAIEGFKYMRQIVYTDSKLSENLQDSLKKGAVGVRGNWFRIAAASSKGVRGPHPGDPHPEMGWVKHGGVLIKDERDEMDDEISDAADFAMDTATQSIIITSSTMHRDDGGGIAQMADEAEARGAKVIKFDVLDVCEVCTHDCATCPGGSAFAGALYGGEKVNGRLANGAPELPRITTKSREAWETWKRNNAWTGDEPAYCLGRAKQHRQGHYKLKKIFRAYKRSRNREVFEVESLCRKRRGARRIVDAAMLDLCLSEDVGYCHGYDTPFITIDWGYMGTTAILLIQPQANSTIAVIDARSLHQTPTDDVIKICDGWRSAYGTCEIFADASHPFENSDMARAEFEVFPVKFQTEKERGAGFVKGIVERRQLRIRGKIQRGHQPGEKPQYIFYSEAEEELFFQVRGWRRDKHGKIVKKDDHFPDSLSCAAQYFENETHWDPDFMGTGKRDSFSVGGI